MAVIVASIKDNPRETSHLPKPFSLRRDKSPIAERASYNFKVGNSISVSKENILIEWLFRIKEVYLHLML